MPHNLFGVIWVIQKHSKTFIEHQRKINHEWWSRKALNSITPPGVNLVGTYLRVSAPYGPKSFELPSVHTYHFADQPPSRCYLCAYTGPKRRTTANNLHHSGRGKRTRIGFDMPGRASVAFKREVHTTPACRARSDQGWRFYESSTAPTAGCSAEDRDWDRVSEFAYLGRSSHWIVETNTSPLEPCCLEVWYEALIHTIIVCKHQHRVYAWWFEWRNAQRGTTCTCGFHVPTRRGSPKAHYLL